MASARHKHIADMLSTRFSAALSDRVVEHYSEMMDRLLRSDWETSALRSGKFIEAVLKLIGDHLHVPFPQGREFSVNGAIIKLEQAGKDAGPDSLRLTIPRAMRFIFDVSSNRGARHDSEEINPNVMDAHGVVNLSSWILAELIRYAQAGKVSTPEAVRLVAQLAEKKYPQFEVIEGRVYFADTSIGATNLALLLLNNAYPERMSQDDLIAAVMRHGHTRESARMGVKRMMPHVDDDGRKLLQLRATGRQKADALLEKYAPAG